MEANHITKIKAIVDDCSHLLSKRNKRIAFAESATAGYIMSAFANAKNSAVLTGGIVCYNASIKTKILSVDPKLIELFSAESIPVTEAITEGLSKLIPADYYIGITGLLKPGGSENDKKPVGTIYSCIRENDENLTNKTIFSGSSEQICEQCLETICMLLIEKISLNTL